MASLVSYFETVKRYLSVELDCNNKFFKTPSTEGVVETKTTTQCKNLQSSYENQRKLFQTLIIMLRNPSIKDFQSSDESQDRIQQKANKLFNSFQKKISLIPDDSARTLKHRLTLASALEDHMNEHLNSQSKDVMRITPARFSSLQGDVQKQLQLGNTHVMKAHPERQRPRSVASIWPKQEHLSSSSTLSDRVGQESIQKLDINLVKKLQSEQQRPRSVAFNKPIQEIPSLSPALSGRVVQMLSAKERIPLHIRGRSRSAGSTPESEKPAENITNKKSRQEHRRKRSSMDEAALIRSSLGIGQITPSRTGNRSHKDYSSSPILKSIDESQEHSPPLLPSSPRFDDLSSHDKLESRTNAKLQTKLAMHEFQYGQFIAEKLDDSMRNVFLQFWNGSDSKGKEIQKIIDQYKSDKPMHKQLKGLCDTPLMGLVLQEQTVRMLQHLPENVSTWSQNLMRQSRYITNSEQQIINPITSPLQSDEENFKSEIEFFQRLLEGILSQLPIGKHRNLKSMIIQAWQAIIVKSQEKTIDNELGPYCCALFLKKLTNNQLFTKTNLQKLELSESSLLYSVGMMLAQLLHSFGQDAYVTPSGEVRNLFNTEGYTCTYRKGAEGRSIKYSIDPRGNVKVETSIMMDFSKSHTPPFSIILRNTLSAFLPLLPNWQSKISLEVISESSDKSQIKHAVLIPLSKCGFLASASFPNS